MVEYGFIDQHTLLEQFARFESGVDDSPEHHRYQSFLRLLDEAVIDDLVIKRFVELAVSDDDQTIAQAALAQLVRHSGLTPHQLSDLKTHPAFASRELQNIIEQTELLREIDSSVLSDDLFNRCLSYGNDGVQRKLLSDSNLSKEQLLSLSDHGANRAIRNLAREKLRRL